MRDESKDEYFTKLVNKHFEDKVDDETKERLKILLHCIDEARDDTVNKMTLELMVNHNLSFGDARIVAMNEMGKIFEEKILK